MSRDRLAIVIALHRIVKRLDRKTAHLLQPYRQSLGQFAILEALLHKGPLTVGQVQEKILSSCGTIPLILRNLEGRGLIHRCQDPQDRRRSILELSGPGRELIEEVYPQNEALLLRELACYSEEEGEVLLSLLKKLKEEDHG